MEIKNKKMVIGVAAMGIGFIAKEIRNIKKIKELDFKINSMNKSMGVFADAHNAFVEKATSEFKQMDTVVGCLVEDSEIHDYRITDLEKNVEEIDDDVTEYLFEGMSDEKREEVDRKLRERFPDYFEEVDDYCVNERLDRIEDEIGSVYEHIEKLATEGK